MAYSFKDILVVTLIKSFIQHLGKLRNVSSIFFRNFTTEVKESIHKILK